MITSSTVMQRVQQFDAAHDPYIYVEKDHWIYFHDGAQRDGNPNGLLIEPPDDPKERAQHIMTYWKHKLDRAKQAFRDHRREALLLAKNVCHESQVQPLLQKVKELRKEVLLCKRKFEDAKRAFDGPPPSPEEIAEQAYQDQLKQTAQKKFVEELESLKI